MIRKYLIRLGRENKEDTWQRCVAFHCLCGRACVYNLYMYIALLKQVNPKLDRPSIIKHLNLDDTFSRSASPHQSSFGITGVSLDNSYGFKMELENFQTAKSNLEVNYDQIPDGKASANCPNVLEMHS